MLTQYKIPSVRPKQSKWLPLPVRRLSCRGHEEARAASLTPVTGSGFKNLESVDEPLIPVAILFRATATAIAIAIAIATATATATTTATARKNASCRRAVACRRVQ